MYRDFKSLNEECGVFGVFNCNNAGTYTSLGLHSLQHRGQEGCGIVTNNGEFHTIKGKGLLKEVINDNNIKDLKGSNAIGHVRYGTSGGGGFENIQPFVFHQTKLGFGLCHNGNIVNSKEIKNNLEQLGSIFQSRSDTELVAHLIMKNYKGNLIESIKKSLNELEGGFSFLFLFEDKLIACRDKWGLRPLSIAKLEDGYIVSSETCAFDLLNAEYLFDVKPAEIVVFDDCGIKRTSYSKEKNVSMCAMEYIYFSRPDSVVESVSVDEFRNESGKILAEKYKIDADVVFGVPDSSIASAMGYSNYSGIKYRMGLVKSKYIARTFIEPTQKLREEKVKLKLGVIKNVVKDKNVILVDDSLVRGTTSKQIIKLLKDAGAKKVHLLIASPPIKYPCFYGVDMSTLEELMAHNKSINEIRDQIGADSLGYLSVEDIFKCYGSEKLCHACFSGEYPTKLYAKIQSANKEGKF